MRTTYTVFVEPTFTVADVGSEPTGYTSRPYLQFRSALRFAREAANVWAYSAWSGVEQRQVPATLAIITISEG